MPINNDSITLQETLMPKVLKSTCRKFRCLYSRIKPTVSLTSFLRLCKRIVNLLVWGLWECLMIPIKNHSISFEETFMLICMQKINLITHFFLKLLHRNSKLVILGNLDMLGDVNLPAKNLLHPSDSL